MNNGKAKIKESINGISIQLPSKKNWFFLLFATAWMGGWFFGFTGALGMFDSGSSGFITFWLIGWTIGGCFITVFLLWGYFGIERFIISGSTALLEKSVFGIGIKSRLKKSELKEFRFEKINTGLMGGNRWAVYGFGPGKIQFDYGFKTYSFGLGLDDAEAKHIVQLLIDKTSRN
ncbi:MAG: hypothetical protein CL840_01675 [Crocinitomicaceae bacterium]|nr:hypothetical protein [Crocinitomicaceae bacterium]|tara:strand:- start:16636 stop:17160 length:525 start_codon:yes stop_codon:yes gene_type:complete